MSVLGMPQGLAPPGRWAVGAAWLLLAVAAPAWAAEGFRTPPERPRAAGAAARTARVAQAASPRPIVDVALRPGEVLEGRAVCREDSLRTVGLAGRPARLWHGSRIVARTTTDRDGRFAFRHLTAGLYGVLVDTADGPCWRLARVWMAEAAPPSAAPRLQLAVRRRVIRGQSSISGAGLPQGAAIVAAAAGAIAVPIIHETAKRDTYIPASP